jgi:TRAP-type C4-dicarboxylate transport system permease large subunit
MLTLPIIFPSLTAFGIAPVQFGVVFVIITAIGTLTPPFGIVIYAMSGAVKDIPLFDIFRGTMPFITAMLLLCLLCVFLPQITLWLPGMMVIR